MHYYNTHTHTHTHIQVFIRLQGSRQVAQLWQRDHAAAWVSCGAYINIVVLRIQRTLL